MEEKVFQFWLHNLPGAGDRTIGKLLKHFGSAKKVCLAKPDALKPVLKEKAVQRILEFNKIFDPQKVYDKMTADGIAFYTIEDEKYPERLRKLKNPPYAVYCLGRLPEERAPAVAVIGARECSGYGRDMAKAFAGKLARSGVSVISGMARGIDGLAQQAALEEGGRTYAVLGCGVDVCYPLSNRELYRKILEEGGGILSVFPPGMKPSRGLFPERNRIVAGLSDLVLVIEARLKSGTCITVDMALEQGKNVYAVPGRLTDRLSDGCNLLLRQGAGIALSPEDFLAEIALLGNRKELAGSAKESRLSEGAEETGFEEGGSGQETIGFLDYYPKSADEILEDMRRMGIAIDLSQLRQNLILLCMEGRAKQTVGNYFSRQ